MILLFGSNSMIGKAITEYCKLWHYDIKGYDRHQCNCLDFDKVYNIFQKHEDNIPEYVISLVGINGNITFNQECPGEICGQTIQMNLNIMKASIAWAVKKVLIPISSCAYAPKPLLKEEEFLKGQPHASVEAHGYARRFLYILGQQYNKQYGNRFVFPVLNNTFGPNDYFERPEKLKVFGTLIKRFIEAKRSNTAEIEIWGKSNSKESAFREGLYNEDAGRLLLKCLLEYENYSLPLNIGLGTDISIYDLAYLIKEKTCYNGKIKWVEGEQGQMKKLLDVSRAKSLGYEPEFTLEQGIERAIEWYNKQYQETIQEIKG